eukprot:scaffold105922_cov58-Attheya_sp.AAC.2
MVGGMARESKYPNGPGILVFCTEDTMKDASSPLDGTRGQNVDDAQPVDSPAALMMVTRVVLVACLFHP